MWTRVPGPPRHRNADVNKEGWPCHRETGMRKPLECGSHWNSEAIGMRMRVPGPPRHRNADVNKEEWPCHRETGMLKPLECGSYWNADKTHGAAQSFDVGMRMQLYRVAWPLENGRRMQLYRLAQPLEIGIRIQLHGVARLLEIGMRMQLYGRLIHLTLESGSSCRRPPSFWSADETHGAAQPFDVQIDSHATAVQPAEAAPIATRPTPGGVPSGTKSSNKQLCEHQHWNFYQPKYYIITGDAEFLNLPTCTQCAKNID
ncbi:hypothetical protein QAD02_007958 [Eretmocerus hayati]|uniref:Uncharacterized protein n=1 Tax=Eretmocerus hayati TaxID=131215 RepID=A0ACC2N6J9_9HYME|nr:hypothetical protein QAD02_007958 [Eretmocerus hayati]